MHLWGENIEKNVTIKKYQTKINDIKNDKIKKSLIELTKVFKQKFPALNVHIIKDGNHHLVNEIESMREDIFSALRF